MPSNNNSNSIKNSMSFGKGKHGMTTIVLLVLILVAFAAYYFMYKYNHEGFESAESLKPESGECIVALFYAPWCGHCKTFKPHFEKAMSELDGKKSGKGELKGKTIRFAKINCDEDENKPLAKKYDVAGYPTVKILKDDGTDIEYDGERSLEGMKKYLVVDT